MITFNAQFLSYFLTIAGTVGVIFTVYFYFRNPQIRSDKDILKLRDDVDSLRDDLLEVKEKHLYEVEQDIKKLANSIQELTLTVTRLGTIIDERMPRQNGK